jgi:hypothetical protein
VRKPRSRVSRAISTPIATTVASCRCLSAATYRLPCAHVTRDVLRVRDGQGAAQRMIERFGKGMEPGKTPCGFGDVLGKEGLHGARVRANCASRSAKSRSLYNSSRKKRAAGP